MKDISSFISALASEPSSDNCANPYRRRAARENLRAYLQLIAERPGRRMLLVGEALGYRGGSLTGIPFSSGQLLQQAPGVFLRQLRDQLTLDDSTAEATATVVWQALARRRNIPLCWNAFPFHPHLPQQPQSNRAPCAAELRSGLIYLQALGAWYAPQLIAGVGNKGYLAARRAFPGHRVIPIRHPSYGGKADFLAGIERLYQRRVPSVSTTAPLSSTHSNS